MRKLFCFFWRLFLALAITSAIPPIAPAGQDIRISGSSYYVTLASSVPWNQIAGNYIFTPESPSVGLCLFIQNNNPSNAHSITIAAFQNGNPALTGYAAQPGLWAKSLIVSNFASIPAASVASLYINATGAANVAVVITGTGAQLGTPDTASVFIVQSAVQQCGSANAAQLVQGAVLEGASAALVNPIVICGKSSGDNCSVPSIGDGGNGWDASIGVAVPADDSAKTQSTGPANGTGAANVTMGAPQYWNSAGVTTGFERMLSINQFAAASATAAGNTVVWAPAQQFEIQCISVDVTGDATQTTAGDLTITLQDATTTIPGFLWKVYVPATALSTSGTLYRSGTACFKNGYKSAASGNSLNVNLSAALATGAVVVRAWGSNLFH